ncbi:heterokaryon incompatibility protein-domain-containing protein [Hypoxylon sp. FL0543]|nr:heterokaryon incompatibility protein-domain-containing protein [Hypoxylon sp. FL0543]
MDATTLPFTTRVLKSEEEHYMTGQTPDFTALFPASHRTKHDDIVPPQPNSEFLARELLVDRINDVQDWLWVLNSRDVAITEDPGLHLVWSKNRIFLKPIPLYLLEPDFWAAHIIHDRKLADCARGFLFSYAALIAYRSDFNIAKEKGLLPSEITWEGWKDLSREILQNHCYASVNPRYWYGELRLSRLNKVYRFRKGFLLRGYSRVGFYAVYADLIRDNFAALATVLGYVVIVLTAMQVGLGVERLQSDEAFQNASYGFTVFSIIAPLIASVGIALMVLIMFFSDWVATKDYEGKRFSEMGVEPFWRRRTERTEQAEVLDPIVPDRSKLNGSGDIPLAYERVDLYPEFPGLLASAKAGCPLCHFIQHEFSSRAFLDIEFGRVPASWASPNASWDRRVKLSANFGFLPFTPVSPTNNFRYHLEGSPPQYNGVVTSLWVRYKPIVGPLRGKDDVPWNGAEVEFPIFDSPDLLATTPEKKRRLPSTSSLSDENVEMMRRWMDDCKFNHKECVVSSDPWVPTRLLEITYSDGDVNLRLVETSNPPIRRDSPFAALSHMWGDMTANPPLCTLSSNYEQLKKLIPAKSLPQNFLDTALACVRLGIRYMWIDSLCIIQDSVEDWRHEAVLMHLVYRNAEVTVVATSATSSHDGFLQRSLDAIPAVKIAYSIEHPGATVTNESANQYMIVCREKNPEERHRMFAVNGSRWNTRAWTMQERSLSTRSIHFCRNRIFYECRNCLRSEDNEPPQESDLINSVLWPRGRTPSFAELYQHWQLFLAEYCQRNLTVATDKLPAIQSVAAEITAVTGREYIPYAGMWLHNLRSELLWHTSAFGNTSRPSQWRAPSWSWASVEGNLVFWQRSFRSASSSVPGSLLYNLGRHPFEVLATDKAYPDPSSETRGFLKVQALAKRIREMRRLDKVTNKRSFFPYDLFIAAQGLDGGKESTEKVFAHGRLDVESDKEGIHGSDGSLIYLHIDGEVRATGLILQRVRSGVDSMATGTEVWRRVGIATLFVDRAQPAINEEAFSDHDLPQTIMLI